ncbi:hypothetical protein H632_c4700p0, partial [Helicosporidium sp. ATCC 50920]
ERGRDVHAGDPGGALCRGRAALRPGPRAAPGGSVLASGRGRAADGGPGRRRRGGAAGAGAGLARGVRHPPHAERHPGRRVGHAGALSSPRGGAASAAVALPATRGLRRARGDVPFGVLPDLQRRRHLAPPVDALPRAARGPGLVGRRLRRRAARAARQLHLQGHGALSQPELGAPRAHQRRARAHLRRPRHRLGRPGRGRQAHERRRAALPRPRGRVRGSLRGPAGWPSRAGVRRGGRGRLRRPSSRGGR